MKIGLIGYGRRAAVILENCLKAAPDLRVAGLVDIHPEEARQRLPEEMRSDARFFDSVDKMMRTTQPEALIIGTRCNFHAPYAMEAAPYGIPLYLEKPVAISMEQAQALERAFQKSSAPVLVSFPLRVSSLCQRAKHILDTGVAGPLEHVLAVNYVNYGDRYFFKWYRDYQITNGFFLQKATHDLDYLMYLVGSPITRVAAMSSVGRVYRDMSTKGNPPDLNALYYEQIGTPETGMNEDSSSALLEFANGTKGVYTQVFFTKRFARRGATLSGVKGTVEFDWYQNAVKTTYHREAITDVSSLEGGEGHFGGDAALAANFIAMVENGTPSLAPIETGLASVYACLAAKQSAETGHFLSVRQVGAA